jgi:hypothetical protein
MREHTRFVGLDVHADTIAVAVAEGRGVVNSPGTRDLGHRPGERCYGSSTLNGSTNELRSTVATSDVKKN